MLGANCVRPPRLLPLRANTVRPYKATSTHLSTPVSEITSYKSNLAGKTKASGRKQHMTSVTWWNLFAETGDLIYYLLYREALASETAEDKTA